MFGKKGMNGTYYAIFLLMGLIIGIGLAWYLSNNGILTSLFCPTPAVATP